MLCLFTVAKLGGASRGVSGTLLREGRGECCGYSKVSMWLHLSMSVKDRAILALMTSSEL
jgi:hypothetical protein